MGKKLYRGITFDASELDNIALGDKDLVVKREPVIDENGNSTLGGGDEYGLYMSDDILVVKTAYGCCNQMGAAISTVTFGNNPPMRVRQPQISVIYEIDSENLPGLRKPKLRGVYQMNNGLPGEEWICDRAPKGSYSVMLATIGFDSIHSQTDIKTKGMTPEQIRDKIASVFLQRLKDLQEFDSILQSLKTSQRFGLDNTFMFKDMFDDNGILKINLDEFNPETEEEKRKFLIASDYKENGFDFDAQNFLYSLKNNFIENDAKMSILDIINEKITFYRGKLNKCSSGENQRMGVTSYNERVLNYLTRLKNMLEELEKTQNKQISNE